MSDELPAPPPIAREVFTGDAWARAEAYAQLLAGPGVVRGLLGPREVPRIWDRHLLNCAVIAEAIPDKPGPLDTASEQGRHDSALGKPGPLDTASEQGRHDSAPGKPGRLDTAPGLDVAVSTGPSSEGPFSGGPTSGSAAPSASPASRVRVVDIGSGAGLPGLVLAIVRPDITVTLLEPLLRRTVFLEECAATLGLDNVEVLRGRAEELKGKRVFDVATARAVAPLGRLLTWSMPLLREGGELIAMKGERAAEELAESDAELRAAGAQSAELISVGHGKVEPPATLVRVVAGRQTPPDGGGRRRRRR